MEGLVSKLVDVGAYGGREYSGRLLSIDRHFNLALADARELRRAGGGRGGEPRETGLGLLLLRGESVAYVAERGGEEQAGAEGVRDDRAEGGVTGRDVPGAEERITAGEVVREASRRREARVAAVPPRERPQKPQIGGSEEAPRSTLAGISTRAPAGDAAGAGGPNGKGAGVAEVGAKQQQGQTRPRLPGLPGLARQKR